MSSVRIADDSDNEGQNYDDIDDMDYELPSAPAASTSQASGSRSAASLNAQQQAMLQAMGGAGGSNAFLNNPGLRYEADNSKFKHYQSIYPIYIDAKRPHKSGERRVSKQKAIAYPKATEIAEACGRFFGIEPVFEPEKCHPRDWANPGRVRVLLKRDGKPINPQVPDKYALLVKLGDAIRQIRKMNGTKLDRVTAQLPQYSPAISYGTFEEALKGGGKMNEMMRSMLGGRMPGAGSIEDDTEAKKRQEEKELAEKQKIARMKALQKQGRRMVVRR